MLPPLYKYLDVHGAKLTLGNRTFRHAKPSDFNDTQDLTIQSIFPEDTETALGIISDNFPDVILRNIETPPTCAPEMRGAISQIQAAFKAHSGAAEMVKAGLAKNDANAAAGIERLRTQSEGFIEEINEFLQGYRVLCVTTHKNDQEMWKNYAEGGKGVALRIEPNVDKDSKFKLFRPVVYEAIRPPLYSDTSRFSEDALFGNKEALMKAMIDKIIYAKTLEWAYENEYRLVVPLGAGENWDTLPYYPEEITELCLGPNVTARDRKEFIGLARAVNPGIRVTQMQQVQASKLTACDVVGD